MYQIKYLICTVFCEFRFDRIAAPNYYIIINHRLAQFLTFYSFPRDT